MDVNKDANIHDTEYTSNMPGQGRPSNLRYVEGVDFLARGLREGGSKGT